MENRNTSSSDAVYTVHVLARGCPSIRWLSPQHTRVAASSCFLFFPNLPFRSTTPRVREHVRGGIVNGIPRFILSYIKLVFPEPRTDSKTPELWILFGKLCSNVQILESINRRTGSRVFLSAKCTRKFISSTQLKCSWTCWQSSLWPEWLLEVR